MFEAHIAVNLNLDVFTFARVEKVPAIALKEIASNTGFRYVQHMTSLFGESFGQTPTRFRKELIR